MLYNYLVPGEMLHFFSHQRNQHLTNPKLAHSHKDKNISAIAFHSGVRRTPKAIHSLLGAT